MVFAGSAGGTDTVVTPELGVFTTLISHNGRCSWGHDHWNGDRL